MKCGILLAMGMIAATALVGADRAVNAFLAVEGDGASVDDDGSVVCDRGVSGPVRVSARPGWLVNGRESVLVDPKGGALLKVTSRLGEDEEHVHVFPQTTEDVHSEDIVLVAEAVPASQIAMYALPDTSTVVSASATHKVEKRGKHKVTTTYYPCECGETHDPQESVSTYEVEPDCCEWTASGPGRTLESSTWTGPMSKRLRQRTSFQVTGKRDVCAACTCMASTNVFVDVHELSVTNGLYLGLDRTDCGRTNPVVKVAGAIIDPEPTGSSAYLWTDCGICSFTGRTDRAQVRYFAPDPDRGSASHLAEPLTVRGTAANAAGLSASANCTTNFTVVKVDVTIGGVGEDKEETEGVFVQYVPDTNGLMTVEGTNKMIAVTFSCEPTDLPTNEVVTITSSGPGELYEALTGGELVLITTTNYPACELSGRQFKLHGHQKSGMYKDGEVVARHENSGATDKVAFTVLGRPRLVPDYNRDGMIDSGDETIYDAGQTTFRFWVNDDNDSEDVNDSKNDRPGCGSNGQPGNVNGRCDLLDFTPVLLDVSGVFPPGTPNSIKEGMSWKLESSVVNAVWTSLPPSDAGSFHRTEDAGATFGPSLSQNAHAATVTELSGGAKLPDGFAQMMKNAGGKGVVMIEGCAVGKDLRLQGYIDESTTPGIEGTLDIEISSVEDMYRWYNSRGLSGESVLFPTRLFDPTNRPDSETSDRHLVFVHGANVSQDDARAWASEVFKRMWQSGMTAKFTAVTWRSDIGADWNYQENVSNAFFTASAIAQQIKDLPGTKVLMAHSLGNMVCSSMIQDYELVPDCYLMCNSAVPAEAYDTDQTLRVPQLVHPEWGEYPTNSWASSWHWLFRNEPDDDRKHLGWPGRFSNVAQYAVNFYSTGDEILEIANNNNIHSWTGISDSWGHFSWHKQELFKGRGGIGGTNWSGWNIEENWLGVNKISVAKAQTMTEADFRTNTVFYCYPPSMNQPTIPLLVRGAHLAQGIPALTPAAGRCTLRNVLYTGCSINLNDAETDAGISRPNDWPEHSDYNGQWCHSDMKDVAYFFNFKFYKKAVEKGDLK